MTRRTIGLLGVAGLVLADLFFAFEHTILGCVFVVAGVVGLVLFAAWREP